MKKNILHYLLCCLLLVMTPMVHSDAVNEDPLKRKMLDIAAKLRCTVCQNQPVAESHSGLASDMRNVITEKLKQGQNEQQIIQYFVDRYGDYVLLEPPQSGNGIVLWVLPPLLFFAALTLAIVVMRSRNARQVTPPPALSEADKERIRRAREVDASEK